jgi:tRNA G18 (ribose-2'-O)-methylase SpoU
LLLGAEGPGLPDQEMAAAETVRIEMAGRFDSLNVATTSGIALYELTRRMAAGIAEQ